MEYVFEIIDKTRRKIRLTKKQWKHIQRHPHMHGYESIERIKNTISNPTTIRYSEKDETVSYFYREFKDMDVCERYLLVSIKYLNGEGFMITSFYTNKITVSKLKT